MNESNNVKKIYYRNDLNPQFLQMKAPSRRLFALCLSKLPREYDGKKTNIVFPENQTISITAKEYSDLCNIDIRLAYKQMIMGAKALMGTQFELVTMNPKEIDPDLTREPMSYEGERFPLTQIKLVHAAYEANYIKNGGSVKITLDPRIAPFVSGLDSEFTSLMLEGVLRLSDINATKLYCVLHEFISQGSTKYKVISLYGLKDMLKISGKYKSWNDFKIYLNKAISTIVKTTEFKKIELCIEEKEGRSVSKVRLSYVI